MARVFVSHASEDLGLAREVHRWLIDAGHEVFLAQDLRDGIAVGEQWEQRLHDELRGADAVVCVLTSAFLASRWCTAEIAIARSRGSRLLPVQAEPGVVDPMLASVQHADLTGDPDAVRPFLIEALRLVDTAWPEDRSPFPGLRPFEVDQHRVFFGRTEETKELAELLRSPTEHAKGAALLVVGPSGCGKSSLVRAGLRPVMVGEPGWWTLPAIVPGANPVGALVRDLAAAARQLGLDWPVTQVRQQLDTGRLGELADELLLATPGGLRRRLLVVVDQFEELLTQTAPTERAWFAELLRPALAGPVQLVATLRPEFLDQLLADPALATLPTQVYPLRPLRRDTLRMVIEKPTQLAGIDVDDGLVDRLVEDTDSGEALPLLAFTLAQLAEGVGRGGQLSAARYEQLGGVAGALIRQADAALADALTAGGRSREQVIAGLLRLVTVDEQGRPIRWRVPLAELPEPVITELRTFVTRRLLTSDTDNGTVVIGVAHEAFLSAWPPLAQAIAANPSALRARRAVEHAATEWHDNGRPLARLWGSGQLAAAVADVGARIRAGNASTPGRRDPARWLPRRHRVLTTDRVDLSPQACDFLHASIRRDRHRRRRTTTVLSVLLILALAAAGVAVVAQGNSEQRLRITTARELVVQADEARNTDPRTALQLGLAAQRIHPDDATYSSLVSILTTTGYAGTLTGHRDLVRSVAFSPDGRTLATGSLDHTVILWDLTDPTRPHRLGQPLTGHTGTVGSVAFSPDGRTLASTSGDRTTILWDLTDPSRPHPIGQPLTGHSDKVGSVAFSPDGRTVATGSFDRTAILWDLTDLGQPRLLGPPLIGHTATVTSVAFAPDGRTVATGSDDGTAILWDLTNSAQPRRLGEPLTGHTNDVDSITFSPDGHTLATASSDQTVILWDLTDPTQPRPLGQPLTGHSQAVYSVAFSPNGRILATSSFDGTVILWDLTDPTQPRPLGQPLTGSGQGLLAVAFSPNGRVLAAGTGEGTAVLWDLTDPTQPRRLGEPLTGQSNVVTSVAFSPNGRVLATGSIDGTVILRDVTGPARPGILGQPLIGRGIVNSVAFSPDGTTLAAGSGDDTGLLWDLTDPARPHPLGRPLIDHSNLVRSVAFSPDGTILATGSFDRTVILWDLTDTAQPRPLGQPLKDHAVGVTSVAFSPNGRVLATASGDRTVILWDLTHLHDLRSSLRAQAVQRACSITGGGFDRAEWERRIPDLPYQDNCPA
ncbi:MAG: nSTAND1 domain-containing NTPase [Pseudonocardiales bacterium]